ncbi:hypothetical protein MMC13_002164 [Lambiella insularis]|nr:hypothetical protein [Lambiella insularis]
MRDGTWTNCTTYENLIFGRYVRWCSTGTVSRSPNSTPETLPLGPAARTYRPAISTTSAPTAGASPTVSSPANPTPTALVQARQPTNWYTAVNGDTCASVEQACALSDALFKQFNPAVNSDCSGLWATYAYCIGTTDQNPAPSSTSTTTSTSLTSSSSGVTVPSPTQVNSIAAKCNKYAEAASGSYCSAIAATNGILTTGS